MRHSDWLSLALLVFGVVIDNSDLPLCNQAVQKNGNQHSVKSRSHDSGYMVVFSPFIVSIDQGSPTKCI